MIMRNLKKVAAAVVTVTTLLSMGNTTTTYAKEVPENFTEELEKAFRDADVSGAYEDGMIDRAYMHIGEELEKLVPDYFRPVISQVSEWVYKTNHSSSAGTDEVLNDGECTYLYQVASIYRNMHTDFFGASSECDMSVSCYSDGTVILHTYTFVDVDAHTDPYLSLTEYLQTGVDASEQKVFGQMQPSESLTKYGKSNHIETIESITVEDSSILSVCTKDEVTGRSKKVVPQGYSSINSVYIIPHKAGTTKITIEADDGLNPVLWIIEMTISDNPILTSEGCSKYTINGYTCVSTEYNLRPVWSVAVAVNDYEGYILHGSPYEY